MDCSHCLCEIQIKPDVPGFYRLSLFTLFVEDSRHKQYFL